MTRVISFFFCMLAPVLVATCARAVQLDTFEAKGVAFVALSGKILAQDADKAVASLVAALEKHRGDKKIVGLALNSPGGLVVEALKIGEFIRTAKIPVLVTEQSSCESACFFIFMNAPAKFIAHGARIGVHSISFNGKEDPDTSVTTIAVARMAREAGVPQSVIGKMVTAEPGDMRYLSDNELKQMGVIFTDDDDRPLDVKPNTMTTTGAPAAPAPPPPAPGAPSPQPSGSISYKPAVPPQPSETEAAERQRQAEIRAEQDGNFARYWSQIVNWSKAQHGGAVASERRCNKADCATVVAYFDRQRRYVEAWRYDEPPRGSGAKTVCRQIPDVDARLSCKDWYDEHEFVISYSHQIGADRVSHGDDLFDIFR